ncbi:MAG: hypothetical protein F9K30_24220 [Dechloromonas sp.]|nr:MAG: hypothetical protein F9K30_24220 [Dechloromonas sp.]
MRAIRNVLVLSLSFTLSACSAAEPTPACASELAPTSTVPPKLSPKLHNEFTGKAQVSFVVSPSGHVQSPTIVSAEWRPVGRSSGQPIGYDEAILAAVSQWRYPQQPQACRHQVPVEFQMDDSSSTAGRSNNSFKPMPLRGTA